MHVNTVLVFQTPVKNPSGTNTVILYSLLFYKAFFLFSCFFIGFHPLKSFSNLSFVFFLFTCLMFPEQDFPCWKVT